MFAESGNVDHRTIPAAPLWGGRFISSLPFTAVRADSLATTSRVRFSARIRSIDLNYRTTLLGYFSRIPIGNFAYGQKEGI
jgi:hypothetical protein